MDRKGFIRTGCSAAMVLMMGGLALGMEGCASLPMLRAEMQGDDLRIPVEKFAESKMLIVRNPNLEFDLLVAQKAEDVYEALELRCTHFANALVVSGDHLTCPMHGSTFGFDGKVTQGPAAEPLRRLQTKLESSSLIIQIPH